MSDTLPRADTGPCLTTEQVETVRGAPAGAVPEDLARHLATCVRCQERVLFGLEPRRRLLGRARPEMPTPTRALLLLGLMVVVMAAFFYTLRLLAGG